VLEARVNRAMVDAAETVVAVCDSSKFNRRSMSLIVNASAIHHVITDSDLPADQKNAIEEAGIGLTLV
jgi:DeoR family transcriptional regulator of aga operon